MRLLAVPQGIYVGVTARKQDAVELCDYSVDVVGLGNQADVHRNATSSLDSLTVIPSQIESISCLFKTHRDADARSCLCHSAGAIPSTAIITHVHKTASLLRQKASLTYIETSSYSLVKENANGKKSGS